MSLATRETAEKPLARGSLGPHSDMHRLLLLAFVSIGCVAPSATPSEEGGTPKSDGTSTTESATCKHRTAAEATASGGTGMDAAIDGENLRFCDELFSRMRDDASGVRTIEVVGVYGTVPGIEDSTLRLQVAISFDPARVEVGKPIAIAGETTFKPAGSYSSYTLGAVEFAPGTAATPAVHSASVVFGCFCTLYGTQKQALTGTLTIDASTEKRVKGHLHLDVKGSIPFWNYGFAKDSTTTVDAVFDTP